MTMLTELRPITYYDPLKPSHLAPDDRDSVETAIAVQEGRELKPGYTEDPFEPLLQVDWELLEENPFAKELASLALEIQNELGNEHDWIANLGNHGQHIKNRLFSWYEVALYAFKVKIQKAYRKEHRSFRDWCQTALGCTVAAINAKIRAARALSHLIAQGFTRLPQSATVAHELAKLTPDEMAIAWARITQQFADHEIKATTIVEFLSDPLTKEQPQFKKANIDFSLYQKLRETAATGGISPQKLLNQILASYFDDERLPISEETLPPVPSEPVADGNPEGQHLSQSHLSDQAPGTVYGGDLDAQIPSPEQGPVPSNPEESRPFESVAANNLAVYQARRQLAQEVIRQTTRNFLTDAPWGELAQELGKEPKEVFGQFKKYLVETARNDGKDPDHSENWAQFISNNLFKNPGSELNCKYWEEFATHARQGTTPTVKAANSNNEWVRLAKSLGYISKFNPETNTVIVPGEGQKPLETVQKRYSLDYLKKTMERNKQ